MASPTIDMIVERHRYASLLRQMLRHQMVTARRRDSHQPPPTGEEGGAMDIPASKRNRTVLISCSEHRTIPEQFLKLEQDDAVLIFRNPGGHVAPILPSILALDSCVTIEKLLIIHHKGCGTTHFSDDAMRAGLKRRVSDREAEVDEMYPGQIRDMEQSVRDNLNYIRTSPFVRSELKRSVGGFVYDLTTGLLNPVHVRNAYFGA